MFDPNASVASFPAIPLSFNAFARYKPFEFMGKLIMRNIRIFKLSVHEDFVILACIILALPARDGPTERQKMRIKCEM